MRVSPVRERRSARQKEMLIFFAVVVAFLVLTSLTLT